MLGSSLCSVAAIAEPQKAAVALQPANLDVVSQPLPVHVAGRPSNTRGRSLLNRHHAASRADAARPNQAAVHLPLRLVDQRAGAVLQPVALTVQTALLPVRATVPRLVRQRPAAVLLLVHQPVLQPVAQKLQAVPHRVLLLADQTVQPVLQLVDLKVQTALHHVHQLVLQPAVLRESTVLLRVLLTVQPVLQPVALKVQTVLHHVCQTVLQLAVPKVPAAATIAAVQMPAKSLS